MKCLVLVISSMALLLASCSNGSKSATSISSTGEVNIRMQETLDSSGTGSNRDLVLFCATTQIYGCCNYTLLNNVSRVGNKITVIFSGIQKPYTCLTSTGPALASIDLGRLSNGNYTLDIVNDGYRNTNTLNVTDGQYAVSNASPLSNISFIYAALQRLPPGTLWSTIGYIDSAQNGIVNSFIDSLNALGLHPFTGAAGKYYYFDVAANLAMVNTNTGYYASRDVLGNFAGDTGALHRIVHNYGQAYKDSIWIAIYTADGNRFLSWTH